MAMLESAASSDTIVVVIPDGRPVLAENKKKEESVRGSFHVLADNVIEDEAVFNQDDLSTTSKREEVSEILPVEDIAAMKKEAKVASVQKASSAPSGKNAGSTISEAEDAEVLTVVEEMPSFPGGEAERNKFLSENIVYPRQAAENGIQGTVYVSFIVDIKGKIEDVKILRGIGGGCDEEALRVVKFMPPWKPGRQNSKNVRVLYNMPVYFKLQ
jgi:protein TonB